METIFELFWQLTLLILFVTPFTLGILGVINFAINYLNEKKSILHNIIVAILAILIFILILSVTIYCAEIAMDYFNLLDYKR